MGLFIEHKVNSGVRISNGERTIDVIVRKVSFVNESKLAVLSFEEKDEYNEVGLIVPETYSLGRDFKFEVLPKRTTPGKVWISYTCSRDYKIKKLP